MPDIALIVTCRDQGRVLHECLRSITAQVVPPVDVIVADVGSTDLYTQSVLASVERDGMSVVRTPDPKRAPAQNLASARTPAPYLAVIDASDTVGPTFVARVADVLASAPKTDVLACRRMASWGEPLPTSGMPDLLFLLTRIPVAAALVVGRQAWHLAGQLDAAMAPYETHDLWTTAWELGLETRILNEALVSCGVANAAPPPDVHRRTTEAFLRKHHTALDRVGTKALISDTAHSLAEKRLELRSLRQQEEGLGRQFDQRRREFLGTVQALRQAGRPSVDLGDLARLTPLSDAWGLERGLPVDRHYIHAFLRRHREDIRGHVLEIKDTGYTRWFGGSRVHTADVLDIDANNPHASLVADLAAADGVDGEQFDCFIMTQTLHIIYDVHGALYHAHRLLKPGGVLLCTVPAVSRINHEDGGLDGGDHWRFTEATLRRLFGALFPVDGLTVTGYGNVQTCAAFLYGMSAEEVGPAVLEHHDPWFPLGYCIRAQKPALPGDAAIRRSSR